MICKLCKSQQAPKDMFYGIVQCVNCGLTYFPYGEDTKQLYSAEYFHGGEYHDYKQDKETLQRNFEGRMSALQKLAPSGKLLELGCAYGFFLEVASKKYSVQGIDISEDGVKHAKEVLGLPARAGDFLSFADEKESYDLICLWDTIEHLSEPFSYLEKAFRWLKPGGSITITTGDFGSVLAKLRGKKWRQIHPPTHLFYFDQAVLKATLEKIGFTDVRFEYVGQYRSYRSMLYEIFKLRHPAFSWVYTLFTLGGRLDLPIYLNTFDIMQATARRPG